MIRETMGRFVVVTLNEWDGIWNRDYLELKRGFGGEIACFVIYPRRLSTLGFIVVVLRSKSAGEL